MTPDDINKIREIIDAATSDGQALRLQSYLIAFIVAVVASAIGAYIGAYLKRRGENLATKEDFAELLRQEKQTTEATEKIKSEIASELALKSKRAESAQKIFSFVIRISTDIHRHHNGQEVKGLYNGKEITPLTEAFNQIQAQRAILGEDLYADLNAIGNSVIKIAKGLSNPSPELDALLQGFSDLQSQFNQHLLRELSANPSAAVPAK